MPVVADGAVSLSCDFPIKVMGRKQPRFVQSVTGIVRKHAPDFDAASGDATEPSGTYLSVTCIVRARLRASSSTRFIRSSATIPTWLWCYTVVEDIVVKRLGLTQYVPAQLRCANLPGRGRVHAG